MAYTKVLLSGSTNGKPIPITTTGTPGDTVDTAGAGTTNLDEIWLFATNVTGSPATITVEFGGAGTGDKICAALSIPANSPPIPIVTGQPLCNSLVVKAFSGTANAINISGYKNRITP